MIGVNLIPQAVLAARNRRRRIRQWLVVTAVVAGVSVVPVVLELRQQARLATLLERKEQDEIRLRAARTEQAELTRSLAYLNERIERADTLRAKRPWAALLSLIVQQMPEEVWLTSLKTGTTNAAPAGRAAGFGPRGAAVGPGQQAVVVMDGPRRIDLQGCAVEHEHLYDFMTRLKQSGAFTSVELVKAGREPVLRSRAVRFELSCSW